MPPTIAKEALLRKLYALYVPVVVVLVGVAAFGLGRLSAGDTSPQPAAAAQAVTASSTQMSEEAAITPATGPYVASKSGSKYYLTSCSAAGRISDANKVYFESAAAAQAAGYAPAANCPGLQ